PFATRSIAILLACFWYPHHKLPIALTDTMIKCKNTDFARRDSPKIRTAYEKQAALSVFIHGPMLRKMTFLQIRNIHPPFGTFSCLGILTFVTLKLNRIKRFQTDKGGCSCMYKKLLLTFVASITSLILVLSSLLYYNYTSSFVKTVKGMNENLLS